MLRQLEDDPIGYDPGFWSELAQMDLLGIAIPAAYGGSEMGALEQAVIAAELGRSIVPSPWIPTVAVGAALLAAGGSEDLKSHWLPRIAKGEAILSIAWHEPNRGESPIGVQLAAKQDGEDFRLSGTKLMVANAASADAILVIARTGTGDLDLGVFLVDAKAAGLGMQQTMSLASDASYEVTFDNVAVPGSARLGAPGEGWSLLMGVLEQALILIGAYAVGGAEATLAMTADYAKERVQFGVPIGSFQGMAHPIADRATEVSAAQTMVENAAWLHDTGSCSLALSAMVKSFACEAYRMATRTGQQTFGGIGFTCAIDVQLYFRRAKQLELSWLGPQALSEIIAAAELDAPEPMIGHDLLV
ncbi:MAG: alkylation response protein AidB-like acyl-CoA dehydrogenase [Glaciecola sp.]